MCSIIFLILGMVVLTSVQNDTVYYPYFMSGAGTVYTPVVLIQAPLKRKMWRLCFTLVGLGLLFLALRSSLTDMPEMYPRIAAVIAGFIIWIILLRISFRVFLNSRTQVKGATFACAFMIPLALLGLLCVIAYMFPRLDLVINNL